MSMQTQWSSVQIPTVMLNQVDHLTGCYHSHRVDIQQITYLYKK